MGGMFNQDPEERMAELEAREAELNGEPGVLNVEEDPKPKPDGEGGEEGAEEKDKVFAPKPLNKETPKETPAEDEAPEYFGIDDEELGYRIPQVDVEKADAALAKREAGDELDEMEEWYISQKEFKDELTDYGLDWDATTVEYHKNGGKLSPETLEKYHKVFRPAMVANYMKGVDAAYAADQGARKNKTEAQAQAIKDAEAQAQADADLSVEIVTKAAGGEKELETLNAWISNGGIAEDELKAVNELITTSDLSNPVGRIALEAVIERLTAKMNAAEGVERPLVGADAPAQGTGIQPLSKADFQLIAKSKEYRTNPIYAKEIDARRTAGLNAGI